MARIELLVFGYRKIYVEKDDLTRASSILLQHSINSYANSDGTISIRERDIKRVRELFDSKIDYKSSDLRGLYGKYKRIPHKPTVALALLISLVLLIVSSGLVWDVRIEGENSASEYFVEYALAEAGFSVGDFWHSRDLSRIETEFLKANPEFAWININRRGGVAYVTLSENENAEHDKSPDVLGYSNIVAAVDCVIEEIRVVHGQAVVKKGDTVKAGDLLISGVISSSESGELCYAEGEVIGRMCDTVTVFVDRSYEKNTTVKETLVRADLKLFNFPINIFKRYSKTSTECDIIEDVKVFSLFGKCLLPITLVSEYEQVYTKESSSYNDAQLVRIASSRLNAAVLKRIVNADLIKIRTSGEFVDNGYTMSSEIEFLGSVGKNLPFEVE